MSETIDIKTKKKILFTEKSSFNKALLTENLEANILNHWDTWGKFQQAWTSRAYKSSKILINT